VDRTPDDLARAAAAAGAVLLSHELVQRRDGSWTVAGEFGFDDPWAAARLLCILAEEDGVDPEPIVRDWADAIVSQVAEQTGLRPGSADFCDAYLEAVHASVQRFIRFEPEEGERFQSADTTLIEGVGDCDCQARLVHALARAAGCASELRFFEQDGEPVHAVAALYTSAAPVWAETTIGAAFGEHPQDAYRRLGLDQENARPDIGFLGIEFVTPDNVAARKAELDAYVTATDTDVTACTALDASTRAAWGSFVIGWKAFMDDKPGWLDSGAQGRQAAEYADAIRQWQAKLAPVCTTISVPTVPLVAADESISLLKTVAVVVGLVAGAVVVVKVLDVLPKAKRQPA
jgi:hypothetical protein